MKKENGVCAKILFIDRLIHCGDIKLSPADLVSEKLGAENRARLSRWGIETHIDSNRILLRPGLRNGFGLPGILRVQRGAEVCPEDEVGFKRIGAVWALESAENVAATSFQLNLQLD